MAQELVLFTRLFDLLTWLLPKTEQFPKIYRHNVTQRLMNAALDCQEAAFTAQSTREARLTPPSDSYACVNRLAPLFAPRASVALAQRWAVCPCQRPGGGNW